MGMAEKTIQNLSQSSLQDFVDCPRRFELRYLKKLNYPAAQTEPILENEKHMQEGAQFHRLVHEHLLGMPVEKLHLLANTPKLRRWFENYLNADLRLADYTLHPEFTLSAPLGNLRLVAKYDLVAVQKNEGTRGASQVIILDWKTYRRRPRDEWLATRLQTRVYRSLLVQSGAYLNEGVPFKPEQLEMIYWFADFPNEPARFKYDATLFNRDWETLAKLTEEIVSAAEYPKTEELIRCSYCPFRSYCERGSQAGAYEALESEMEAEELFDIHFEQIGEIAF
ncbi:MAG: hypothetical protein A2Y54_02575 [Chloroflexi bacterium RBG_16_51_16]|nr:MAG: hypothetical protein A2Y54_02575 [Chloroflexi bacterium RBG_16_51_16]